MRKCRRIISFALTLVLVLGMIPATEVGVRAQERQIPIPEIPLSAEILASDVFYLASTTAALQEGQDASYLLRVGRGGATESESSVLVKISDVTANYGRDYKVSVLDGSAEVQVPEDNVSLMDRIAGEPFVLTELKDAEEALALLEEDEEAMEAAGQGLSDALDYLGRSSGVTGVARTAELDPVQEARNLFTGLDGTTQKVTATQDMFRQLQQVANVMTEVVPGASVKLSFAPGETEKYLVITPIDNNEGDGERYFYVILAETEGSTTNSAASTCAVTVSDDEVQIPSVVSFSQPVYSEIKDDTVTVTLKREGALNTVVTATVLTGEGTAVGSRDYSEVNREILFPFGVSEMTVDIPVRTEYFAGEADFRLRLAAGSGCTVGEDARVVLTGTMQEAAAAEEPAALRGGNAQSLVSPRVLSGIDIANPTGYGHEDNKYGGTNEYDSKAKTWHMRWKDNSFLYNRKGSVGVYYDLCPGEDDPIWISGARVTWYRTGDDFDLMVYVVPNHLATHGFGTWATNFLPEWDGKGSSPQGLSQGEYPLYSFYSRMGFKNWVTVDLYPSKQQYNRANALEMFTWWQYHWDVDPNMISAKWIGFYNHARCDECGWLNIKMIEPILRPFDVTLLNATETMTYLQADGSYAPDSGDATRASLKDSVDGHVVVYLDDSVTVTQPSGQNLNRYAALTALEYLPAGREDKKFTVQTTYQEQNDGASSLTLKLSKEQLKAMYSGDGLTGMDGVTGMYAYNSQLMESYKQGANAAFYDSSLSWSYPSYGIMQLRPKFSYIDSRVSFQNPYDFPITVTMSGTEYTLEPKSTLELEGIHHGDTLAITSVKVPAEYENEYRPFGVHLRYSYSDAWNDQNDDTKRFTDVGTIYIGGKDRRLDRDEVIIIPALTQVENEIVVRVKTDEVSRFDGTGVLACATREFGEYTEFVFASHGQVVNGKLYPLYANPADENDVCVWTVNSGLKYLGGTFLFEGGRIEDLAENIIYLTTEPAASEVRVTGTLNYMAYNLADAEHGAASAKPAAGAAVAAASMVGTADQNGRLETTSMKVPASPENYRVRCMISANGSNVVRDLPLPAEGDEIDISSTFSSGLSPVMSAIFDDAKVSSVDADEDNLIAIGGDLEKATVSFSVTPVTYRSQRSDGNGGFVEQLYYEKPVSVQFLILDQRGQQRYAFEPLEEALVNTNTGVYTFTQEIPYKYTLSDGTVLYSVEAGDRIFVRLTTNYLEQTEALEVPQEILDELNQDAQEMEEVIPTQFSDYTYSEIYTGLSFYAPPSFVVPVKQGLSTPIELSFISLPFLGSVGMDMQFPFVDVGWMATDQGYRMYIGVSPVNIYEAKSGNLISKFIGDNGTNYGKLWSIGSPFKTYGTAIKTAWTDIMNVGKNGVKDTASMGSPQWRFNCYIGIYFDFWTPKALSESGDELKNVSPNKIANNLIFAGIGGYLSFSGGFKVAWYTVIPVVMIPGYFGVNIDATVMGFLGAKRNSESPNVICYEDAVTTSSIRFENEFDRFNYAVQAIGSVQISLGVGLFGTLGARLSGKVNVIGNYEPTEVEGIRDWGAYLTFSAGGVIDLFLFSVPLMYTFKDIKLGKFEDFEDAGRGLLSNPNNVKATVGSAFTLRSGSDEASQWLGASTKTRGAFTPKQTYTLVENSYERADPQLITMSDGTVVLAYLSNDPDKGPYQRTTLMLTTYKNGVWSEPVAVSDDGTADFSPSIAEAKGGRVLIAWTSTEAADITDETEPADYLRQMEVFAAFAEIGANGQITVGETSRITKDLRIKDGEVTERHYYDSSPTAVTDLESGDAMIYFIKSGSASADAAELANAYINDSIVCYLPYDAAKGKWMTDEFYPGELDSPEEEEYLINNFCGQRFLDTPTFQGESGTEYYAIPDFTAIGYNNLAIFAYTIDKDSSNDTETDKEIFLQVYSFAEHKTYYKIQLTDDLVSDAMPQFFRAKHAGETEEEQVHTKLFWFRNGDGAVYLDVSKLLTEGINPDGTIKLGEDGTSCAVPSAVATARENEYASVQMADFRVVEDSNGSIYVVWTEGVEQEDGVASQELFATAQMASYDTMTDEEAENAEHGSATGWSKPYQLTSSGLQNDEFAVTLVGDELLVVHNQYRMELTEDENNPLAISDLKLAATTLEPCGSVETTDVRLYSFTSTTVVDEEDGTEHELRGYTDVDLPAPGETVEVRATVANNGLTTAQGFRAEVYQVVGGREKLIWSCSTDEPLRANSETVLTFDWTLPQDLEGATIKVETRENNYFDRFTYTMEPLALRADYELSNVSAYQTEDGFQLKATVTNVGNGASKADEKLTVRLTGPFDLPDEYEAEALTLYAESIGTLAPGEAKDIDVKVEIPNDMIAAYNFVNASVSVRREETVDLGGMTDTRSVVLGNSESVEFKLVRPVNFRLNGGKAYDLAVGEKKKLSAEQELGEELGGTEIVYTVGNPGIARIENGKLLGVAEGETVVYATHTASGAAVSVPVTVQGEPLVNPFEDVEEGKFYYEPVLWAYYHDPQITSGTSETTFSPKKECTRGEVVTFLWRAAGSPEPETTENPFEDVPSDKFYYKAVLWAFENGITSGTSDTTFSPKKTCTRGEVVTFLWRTEGSPEPETAENPFEDVPSDKFYYKPVLWAFENGITSGTSNTTFSPKKTCTRGEIVTFLYRYMEG